MSPVNIDYHADDDPPLIILGAERTEYREPPAWKVPALLVAFIVLALFYCLFNAYVLMPADEPQELLSTDRDMPAEQVAGMDD